MEASFDLSFVSIDQKSADDIRKINALIEGLTARRKVKIEVLGPYAQSKIAWKIATYQQAILYRVVMLARGTRDAWNFQNILMSFLAARALTETLAVFDSFEQELSMTLDREDIQAMDQLVMHRMFSTRDGELLEGHQHLLAINVLTFIDKFGKRYGLPIRNHYDTLSEHCHPNSAGHHQMYSSTDMTNGTVTFNEIKKPVMELAHIRPALGLLYFFERTMDQLDSVVLKAAALQHRLDPQI